MIDDVARVDGSGIFGTFNRVAQQSEILVRLVFRKKQPHRCIVGFELRLIAKPLFRQARLMRRRLPGWLRLSVL